MCRDARQGYHDLPAYRTCLGIRGWSDGNEAETCICGTVRAYAGGVSITSRFPNFVEISLGAEWWQRKGKVKRRSYSRLSGSFLHHYQSQANWRARYQPRQPRDWCVLLTRSAALAGGRKQIAARTDAGVRTIRCSRVGCRHIRRGSTRLLHVPSRDENLQTSPHLHVRKTRHVL